MSVINKPANPASSIKAEEIVGILVAFGEDPTADRAERILSHIDVGALPVGAGRAEALTRTVDAIRRELASKSGPVIMVSLSEEQAQALGYDSVAQMEAAVHSDAARQAAYTDASAYQSSSEAKSRKSALIGSGLDPDQIVWVDLAPSGANLAAVKFPLEGLRTPANPVTESNDAAWFQSLGTSFPANLDALDVNWISRWVSEDADALRSMRGAAYQGLAVERIIGRSRQFAFYANALQKDHQDIWAAIEPAMPTARQEASAAAIHRIAAELIEQRVPMVRKTSYGEDGKPCAREWLTASVTKKGIFTYVNNKRVSKNLANAAIAVGLAEVQRAPSAGQLRATEKKPSRLDLDKPLYDTDGFEHAFVTASITHIVTKRSFALALWDRTTGECLVSNADNLRLTNEPFTPEQRAQQERDILDVLRSPGADDIVRVVREAGNEHALDDAVRKEFSAQALCVNEEGLAAQVSSLLEHDWSVSEIAQAAGLDPDKCFLIGDTDPAPTL
ncbi:hypothetical protein R70006_06197 [Paraburkholderia domus]|uniref:hypothetical protein n=1 Tax=Paraburkholderia domus TaxID=2793075 RepID=UPI00191209AD|nr:hypothetical protein [Paraburkholderia domus]MBK5052829.1 hypothetical protein [Burkholderia sp. R-70006]CAE6821019.1 hypothetical protein R70006_06197 [Paraburkholderia domus]